MKPLEPAERIVNNGWMPGIRFSTFWAMVRKELTVIARYPVEFIASFGRVFLIVAIFTLGGSTFTTTPSGLAAEGGLRGGDQAGLVVYGFILFMFLSDTLWTIGYAIRHEQVGDGILLTAPPK